ncbi:hypothetical protein HDV05_000061 [Chytridiales sp. JEL 0842]|nr:hypothetical protein HDV05_000061 [Chytridiales sp. JEL 0842]
MDENEKRFLTSGMVFVYGEKESGIKRWTDGKLWSPSRIRGNFLVYNELETKIPKSRSNQQRPVQEIAKHAKTHTHPDNGFSSVSSQNLISAKIKMANSVGLDSQNAKNMTPELLKSCAENDGKKTLVGSKVRPFLRILL